MSRSFVPPTREELALLDVIASSESSYGNGEGYDVMYGGDRFSDFSDHPRVMQPITVGPNTGRRSSAAGRYQFLGSTWDSVASQLGLSDFSPRSQDMAALQLARDAYRRQTGRNLADDLASADPSTLAQIGQALSGTWTSLPSGIEETQSVTEFQRRFERAVGAETPGSALGGAQLAAAQTSEGSARVPASEAPGAPRTFGELVTSFSDFDTSLPDDELPNTVLLRTVTGAAGTVFGPGSRVVASSGVRNSEGNYGHRNGNGVDFAIYDADGNLVRWDDPRAVDFVLLARELGVGGIGFGPDYMGGNSFHMDLMHTRVWSDDDGGASDSGPGAAQTDFSGVRRGYLDTATAGPLQGPTASGAPMAPNEFGFDIVGGGDAVMAPGPMRGRRFEPASGAPSTARGPMADGSEGPPQQPGPRQPGPFDWMMEDDPRQRRGRRPNNLGWSSGSGLFTTQPMSQISGVRRTS